MVIMSHTLKALEFNTLQKKIIIIGNKNITTNIYRIQVNDVMFGYFCIEFIKFMLEGKGLLDYTNLFSPKKYEKNDKIIMKYFQ